MAAAGAPRKNGGQGVPHSARGAGKRFACALLAALILAQVSVSRPAKAGAFLPAITGAAVVSAWLMTCGIYPYISEDGQSFGEWGAGQLRDLWNSYIDSFSGGQTPSGGTKETFDKISGFVTGKTIAIAKGLWSELRAFANWIVDKFSVTDNQTGVELSLSGAFSVPVFSSAPSKTQIVQDGLPIGTMPISGGAYGKKIYVGLGASDEAFFFVAPITNSYGTFSNSLWVASWSTPYLYYNSYYISDGNFDVVATLTGNSWTSGPLGTGPKLYFGSVLADVYDFGLPIYGVDIPSTTNNLQYDVFNWLKAGGNVSTTKNSVTVDTTTVSVPAELPETATYGGLTVPDAISGTAPAITDVIEQGVTDRTQPVVKSTVVTLEDVTVDNETGEITDDTPVTITPEDIPYSSAQFQIPSLETVFPFSIPWDIGRVYGALNAEPQRPEFHFTLTFPIVGEFQLDVAIPDDVAPQVDAFAAFFRNLILVLLCVWLLFQAKDWVQFS